jgi:hypothetical protein
MAHLQMSGTARDIMPHRGGPGGDSLVHVLEQDVTVTRERGVVRIVDRPIPAERERLDAFIRRHGIARPR